MKNHMYRDYSQVRQSSQLLMRKYYMGKKKKNTKLATWNYITCTHTLFCYANSTDDNVNNKVPDTFPGTIGLVNDNDGTNIVLNPKHRINTDELHYYISRILAAINPT